MKPIYSWACWLGWCLCILPLRVQAADAEPCLGWIAVESAPVDGASILMDGNEVGQNTPATLKDIACGNHEISVNLPFYLGGKAQIKVVNKDVTKVKLTLKANFGSATITSQPSGAKIELDGKLLGEAPLTIDRIAAGAHEIKAFLPDHRDATIGFTVKQGAKAPLVVKLKPAFGKINVSVKPKVDAMVYLNGDALGTAPLTLKRIVSGGHTVRVVKEFYKPFETKVSVVDGQTTAVNAILDPDYGILSVKPNPLGGEVKVDGKPVGKSPLTLNLSPGEHQVTVAGPGASYGDVEQKVKILLLVETRVEPTLPIRMGGLMIDTIPFAAEIEIDSKPYGKAPLSLKEVPIGTHQLLAKMEGHPPLNSRLQVLEGQTAVAELNVVEPNKSVYRYVSGGSSDAPKPVEVVKNTEVSKPVEAKKAVDEAAPPPLAPIEETPASSPATAALARADKPGAKDKPKPEVTAAPASQNTGKPETKTAADSKPGSDPQTAKDAGKGSSQVVAQKSEPSMSSRRLWAWITTGTAGAFGVGAISLFALHFATQKEADRAYQNLEPQSRVDNLDNKAASQGSWAWAMTGAMLATAGVSVYLFVTEPESSQSATAKSSISLVPLPGGGWVGLQGRF